MEDSKKLLQTKSGYKYVKDQNGNVHLSGISINPADAETEVQTIIHSVIQDLHLPLDSRVQYTFCINMDNDMRYCKKNISNINDPIEFEFDESGQTILGAQSITVDIVILKKPSGGGNGINNPVTDLDLKKKRCIITVDNQDYMCAVRASLISFYHAIKHFDYREICKKDRNKQTEKAIEVCETLNFNPDHQLSYDDLNIIAKFYQEKAKKPVRIIVINPEAHLLYDTAGNTPGSESDIRIYILKVGDHFHAVVNPQGMKNGKYFCRQCHIYSSTKANHNCYTSECNKCKNKLHNRGLRCENCKRRICDICEHECGTIKRILKIKENQKQCDICKQVYIKDEEHICYTKQCPNCKNMVFEDHECFIQRTTFKGHVGELLAFDYECAQDNELYQHIPVLIVVRDTTESYDGDLTKQKVEKDDDGSIYRSFNNNYDFCEWLFNRPQKTTAIAHNGGKYDTRFILNYLICKGIKPKVVLQGNNIKKLQYKKVTVLDSYAHIPLPLRSFTKIFGLETKKGDFPIKFISNNNIDYRGKIPDKKYFVNESKDFNKWYDDLPEDHVWEYKKEIYEYCKSDVKLLYEGCQKFRELFDLSKNLRKKS